MSNRDNFTKNPCFTEIHPDNDPIPSTDPFTQLEDVNTFEIPYHGGYHESLEEIDEYVNKSSWREKANA